MQIKVIFLGTGTSQGVPVIGCNCKVCQSKNVKDQRLRSSVLISINNYNILIDIGPDFRSQMLNSKMSSVDCILFTHHHRDHTAGLDDIRPVFYLHKKSIQLFAERNVLDSLQHDYRYLFSGTHYPGKPQLKLNVIDNTPFFLDKIKITPIRAMHYKLPVLGFRIGDMAYITDANYISSVEKKKLIGLDVFILNSLEREKHISHYSLKESLEIINEVKPKKAYLTHISHNMGLYTEVMKELPENVALAYDNLTIKINY